MLIVLHFFLLFFAVASKLVMLCRGRGTQLRKVCPLCGCSDLKLKMASLCSVSVLKKCIDDIASKRMAKHDSNVLEQVARECDDDELFLCTVRCQLRFIASYF